MTGKVLLCIPSKNVKFYTNFWFIRSKNGDGEGLCSKLPWLKNSSKCQCHGGKKMADGSRLRLKSHSTQIQNINFDWILIWGIWGRKRI